MDTEEIQTTFNSYFENLYSTKFENSKEIDKILHNYPLPKLNKEQTNNINGPKTPNDIEEVSESLLTKKKPKARWLQCRIRPEIEGRANSNNPQIVPHNRNKRLITKL